jgi:nitroreductase
MNTIDAIYARRSVKQYDPAHRMSEAEIATLIDAAMQSPTSFNIQQWRFVVVTNPELRAQIRKVGYDQAQITDSSILIVLAADQMAWAKDPARYWAHAPKPVQDMLVPWMGVAYKDNTQLQRDEAMRSMGIAMQTIMIAAKAMGYDSCPMIGFEPDKVAQLVRLPSDHVLGALISVGKGIKPAWPKTAQLPRSEVLIRDRFPA